MKKTLPWLLAGIFALATVAILAFGWRLFADESYARSVYFELRQSGRMD